MAGVYINRADPLMRRESDKGYRVGWRLRRGFQKSHLEEEMTYGEAKKKAEELQAKEPDKVFFPEMIMDPNF